MTILDIILLAALMLALPAEALWHTMGRRDRPRPALTTKLVRTLRVLGVLLILLTMIWVHGDRPAAWLGLDAPLSTGGLIGLAVAVTILGLLGIGTAAMKARGGSEASAAAEAVMPRTPAETRLFIVFAVAAGIGWELLYRGFLLWALTPLIGLAGAVIVAAIAYALGHGSRDTRSLVGSTISSFLFTIGFALTGSLWWLIILHIGLPLVGLVAMCAVRSART